MNKIVLASASPRRKELLAQIGCSFEIITSDAEEITQSKIPENMVEELSLLKAKDVFLKLPEEKKKESLVIGADTVVSCDEKVLGKPKDKEHAFEMLKLLQGRTHYVYTGVTLICGKASYDRAKGLPVCEKEETAEENRKEYQCITFHEATAVKVFPMSDEEIWEYIETGEPMDKAGSYGIQASFGAKFIERIEGDYYNVVGLPVSRLYHELKKLNISI